MWMRTFLVTILAALSYGALPAMAQPSGAPLMGGPPMGHMKREESPAMMLGMVLKHANLKPEQQTQVRKIMDDDHQRLRALFGQLRAANGQLADKLFAPGPVQASDLQQQIQQIAQFRQQLMEQGVKTALAIRAVLTPEQLAKAAQTKDRIEKLQTEMRSLLERPE